MDRSNSTFIKFLEILNQITKEEKESEEDKTRSYWEKALIDSWERLIDRDETNNNDFFALKENLLSEVIVNQEISTLEEAKLSAQEQKNARSVQPSPEKGGKLRHEL